jgi:hypothetical protein
MAFLGAALPLLPRSKGLSLSEATFSNNLIDWANMTLRLPMVNMLGRRSKNYTT